MFRRLGHNGTRETLRIEVDGRQIEAPSNVSLATALLLAGAFPNRTNPVHERDGQKSRAPYCMMGVCFECLVTVDGEPNLRSCLSPVREGMKVERQTGAADLMRAGDRRGGA